MKKKPLIRGMGKKVLFKLRKRTKRETPKKYCNNKCQHEFQVKIKYDDYLNNQNNFTGKEITYNWLKKSF